MEYSLKEKIKKIGKTEKSGLINMFLKPLSILLNVIYTPLLLSFLGGEKYGLWATILSIIIWVNYFDVGIGNGLRNVLSKELANKNYISARKSISTAYIVLSGISLLLFILLMIIGCVANWNEILTTEVSMRIPILISFFFICLNFVLSLSNTIFYALQKPEVVSLRGCLSQLINIVGIIIISNFTSEDMIIISILFGMSSTIIYLLNHFFILKKYKNLKPSFKFFDKTKIKEICNIGLKFFIIQLMCLVIFTTDNIIITHFFGAEELTPFDIANKVFQGVYSVFAAFLVPYWSKTTEIIEKNDIKYLKKSIKNAFKVCLFFFMIYIFFAIIFKPLVSLWLHQDFVFQNGLIITMLIYFSLYSILAIECQFINGSGKINVQLYMYLIIGILNIPFSVLLGVNVGLGPVGVRLVTTFLVAIADIVLGINLYNIVKKLENNERNNL